MKSSLRVSRRGISPGGVAGFAWLALAILPALSTAQGVRDTTSSDRRPTLAVWDFETSAIGRDLAADYAPISKAVALTLASKLARNPNVRVVNRSDLQRLLEEQNLGTSGRVDPTTVVRVGKLLGVRHFVGGSFIVNRKNVVSVTITVTDAETGALEPEYSQEIKGDGDNVEELIAQLGERMNKALHLPDIAPASNATKPESGANVGGKRGSLRELVAIGLALDANDRKDVAQESQLWKAFKSSASRGAFVEVQQYADDRLRIAEARKPD